MILLWRKEGGGGEQGRSSATAHGHVQVLQEHKADDGIRSVIEAAKILH